MKKFVLLIVFLGYILLLAACSSDGGNSESSSDSAQMNTEESAVQQDRKNASSGTGAGDSADGESQEGNTGSQADESAQADRKIIYTANLRIEVKDYQKAVKDIQSQVSEHGGYIVESHMSEGSEDGSTNGTVKARVPQGQFREFVQFVEDGSSKVLESNISGQDVTEEYVDLESRLESKRVVEKRLLNFMEQAEKTEDLLKISEDLAKVQEEIEQITGRMNYLENKVNLATVTIHIQENNVTISGSKDLNTWEKTKQQFMRSINFLISAFSGIFVFLIGNLPVLILLGAIALGAFLIVRKSRKKDK
ncbi:DUF4349 domain-containing protein [Virgibacillus doumboii]|uniref:DUF4349 domain-containing protein n=1 Tax=Virgibacillus doumboii TaxID=2697503 RepID=UPI001FE26850|nr:DUF4349 domain-containing protein [Virgibacillus doumboii]